MSFSITEAFVQQYAANVLMLSQQYGSKLRAAVNEISVTGEHANVERIGSVEAVQVTTRHGDTPLISTPHSRRRLTLSDWEWADLIDDLDKVKMLIDPQSPYVRNAAAAMNRRIDRIILEAIFGNSWVVSGGTATETSPYGVGACRCIDSAGAIVTAGTALAGAVEAPLDIETLMNAKVLLDQADIDPMRKRYFVLNARNLMGLIDDSRIQSSDYNTVKALVRGEVDTFLGFTFIQTELVNSYTIGYFSNDGTADTNECHFAAFCGDAITLGIGKNPVIEIDKRPDKRNSTQVYTKMSIGATRVEDPAVVQIGADIDFTIS